MGNDGKITKESIGFILCNSINKIIDVFISTFLVAYLLTVSSGNIFNIAIYYLMIYSTMIIFYPLFSFFLHKINKLFFYRIGILLRCLFLLIVTLLKADIVNYVVPIAIFYGIEASIYWSSYNTMMNEAVSSKSMQKFYGIYNICGYIISIVAPLVLGVIIDAGSFIKTAVYALIICVCLFLATFLLKNRKENAETYGYKSFFNSIKSQKNEKLFNSCYLMCFFNGLRVSTTTIVTILIVLTFKSNVSLGSLSSIMSALGIIITFIFTKKYKNSKYKILWLTIGLALSSIIGILLNINKVTIVLFKVLYTLSAIIPDNLYTQRRMGIIRITKNIQYALEHNVFCEVVLNIGRSISFLIVLLVSQYDSMVIYKILLSLDIVLVVCFFLSLMSLEIKYYKMMRDKDTLKHLKEVEEDAGETYFHYKDTISKEIK